MPRPYNYAQLYHRPSNRAATRESAETEPMAGRDGLTYEQYCSEIGVDVGASRRSTLVASLASYLADDPVGRALEEARERQATRPHCVNTLQLASRRGA